MIDKIRRRPLIPHLLMSKELRKEFQKISVMFVNKGVGVINPRLYNVAKELLSLFGVADRDQNSNYKCRF